MQTVNLLPNNFNQIIENNYNNNAEYNSETENSLNNIAFLDNQFKKISQVQMAYLEMVKTGIFNLYGVDIRFDDMIWDFSSLYVTGKRKNAYTYNFYKEGLDKEHTTLLKLYALNLILEKGVHVSSNKNYISGIKDFLLFMQEENCDMRSIDPMFIEDYLDLRPERSYKTRIKVRSKIAQFIKFYSVLIEDVFTNELADYFEDVNKVTMKALKENGKRKLLDTDFYHDFVQLCYKDAKDETRSKYERGLAVLLYIDTQTGLRQGELRMLEIDDLKVEKLGEKVLVRIEYSSTKGVRSKNKIKERADTRANERIVELWKMCEELFEEDRKILGSKCLVVADPKIRKQPDVTGTDLYNFIMAFCIRHCRELGVLNSDMDCFHSEFVFDENIRGIGVIKRAVKEAGLKIGDRVKYPIFTQFRVYTLTELKYRGVSNRIRRAIANHDSYEMAEHYARATRDVRDEEILGKELIGEVLTGTKLMGSKGQYYEEKMNEILAKGGVKVVDNLDEAIEMVAGELPIKVKELGFCIKSNPDRECSYDKGIDEYTCCFGVCPNDCFVYYNIPYVLDKIRLHYRTYLYNKDIGYENFSDFSKNKMLKEISLHFEPEYEELLKELAKDGGKEKVLKHEKMDEVVEHLDEIREEINRYVNEVKELSVN